MPPSQSNSRLAIHAVITKAAVRAVGDSLRWNVTAYGKAWTEEDEDTRFLCHNVSNEVIAALDTAGYQIVRKAQDWPDGVISPTPPPPEDVQRAAEYVRERGWVEGGPAPVRPWPPENDESLPPQPEQTYKPEDFA